MAGRGQSRRSKPTARKLKEEKATFGVNEGGPSDLPLATLIHPGVWQYSTGILPRASSSTVAARAGQRGEKGTRGGVVCVNLVS